MFSIILIFIILFSITVSAFPEHIPPSLRAIVLFGTFTFVSLFAAFVKSNFGGANITSTFLNWLVWSAGFAASYYFVQTNFIELSLPVFWFFAAGSAAAADI